MLLAVLQSEGLHRRQASTPADSGHVPTHRAVLSLDDGDGGCWGHRDTLAVPQGEHQ